MTDWEKINREDRQRNDDLTLQLGWIFTGGAVVGGVVGSLLGHADRALTSSAFGLLIGVPLLVLGLRAQRRKRTGSDGQAASSEKWYQRRPSPQQLRKQRRWAIPLALAGAVLMAISLFMVYG